MLLLAGPRSPGVQPHPHLRYPARPVSLSSFSPLLSVFTVSLPAWRVGEFLFASHTAQSSPNVALLHPHCPPIFLPIALQLPQHLRPFPHYYSALSPLPDTNSGQPRTDVELFRL